MLRHSTPRLFSHTRWLLGPNKKRCRFARFAGSAAISSRFASTGQAAPVYGYRPHQQTSFLPSCPRRQHATSQPTSSVLWLEQYFARRKPCSPIGASSFLWMPAFYLCLKGWAVSKSRNSLGRPGPKNQTGPKLPLRLRFWNQH